uniref:Scavenger receptor class F member 2 n=1 Tax=Magallana gigas TaxID=29159 RepID=K1QFV1_MAGGI
MAGLELEERLAYIVLLSIPHQLLLTYDYLSKPVESIFYTIGCRKHGVYGSNCDIPCPINCKDNTCHIENGSCLQCEPGWFGGYCNRSMSFNTNTS